MKKYSLEHIWVEAGTDNTATLGISKLMIDQLGDIVFLEFPVLNKQRNIKEPFCVLESSKSAIDLEAPLSGYAIAINEELKKDLTLLKNSPEGKGWICKWKMTKPEECDKLLNEKEYTKSYSPKDH